MQAPEAARQVAQEALLARAVLGRQAAAADVGGRVGRRVAAGVAQRLVGMRALGVTNVQSAERRSLWRRVIFHLDDKLSGKKGGFKVEVRVSG